MQPAASSHSETADTEIVPVDIDLLEIERTNAGRIHAYAAVEIEIAGRCFILQGITVSQDARGHIIVDLPTFQWDGRRLPTFVLPDELIEPAGKLVFDAYREMMAL
jgi:hypothetical protein